MVLEYLFTLFFQGLTRGSKILTCDVYLVVLESMLCVISVAKVLGILNFCHFILLTFFLACLMMLCFYFVAIYITLLIISLL